MADHPYRILIIGGSGSGKTGIDHHIDPRAYSEYSNDMHDVYKNINYYNPDKENKILIVFDDMIADMIITKS